MDMVLCSNCGILKRVGDRCPSCHLPAKPKEDIANSVKQPAHHTPILRTCSICGHVKREGGFCPHCAWTTENLSDPVNQPAHYTTGKIECIDFIEDKKLDFHTGNALKYITRAGIKDRNKEIEDLQKAIWYLNRKIENLKKARGL